MDDTQTPGTGQPANDQPNQMPQQPMTPPAEDKPMTPPPAEPTPTEMPKENPPTGSQNPTS